MKNFLLLFLFAIISTSSTVSYLQSKVNANPEVVAYLDCMNIMMTVGLREFPEQYNKIPSAEALILTSEEYCSDKKNEAAKSFAKQMKNAGIENFTIRDAKVRMNREYYPIFTNVVQRAKLN